MVQSKFYWNSIKNGASNMVHISQIAPKKREKFIHILIEVFELEKLSPSIIESMKYNMWIYKE